MLKQLLKVFLCCVLTCSPAVVHAASKKAKTIPCPPVIGDKREAVLHDTRLRASQPFQCFRSQNDARNAGYITRQDASLYNYSGWYRLRVKSVKDNCSTDPVVGGNLVLFLQIKENADGVFANFCPSTVDLQGSRTGSGLSASGTESTMVLPSTSICPDGHVAQTRHVTMNQIIGSSGFSASYKVVQVCQNPAYRGKTCSKEYSGVAFLETHTMWPKVAENILDLQPQCEVATQTCASCHAFFND